MLRTFFVTILFMLLPCFAFADGLSSPVGTWQTLNDETQQPNSLVKISQENAVLVGRVHELLSGSHFKTGDVCSACPEPFKNQAIVGLPFLWGFVRDQSGTWKDGQVLDPRNGHIYKGTLRLVDQGRKMELRGYWGPFWRTQVWTRVAS